MLVLIPILAMLVLGFIAPGKIQPSAKALLFIIAVGLMGLITLRSLLPDGWIFPEGDAVTHVRAQVDHLLNKYDWQRHPVIILEGSSATEHGINGALLEQLLVAHGLNITVLQFSLPGANHFERLWMLELFLQEIGAHHRQELKSAPTIVLSEVFDAYDQDPLYLFQKEAYSHRVIAWTSPYILAAAWQASKKYTWVFYEHLMLNRFAVGIFSSMEPLNYRKKTEAFCPLTGTKKTFHFADLQKAFEEATSSYTHDRPANFIFPYSGWALYEKKFEQQLGNIMSVHGFYALPTLEAQRRNYQLAFAQWLPAGSIMIGPPSLTEIKSLTKEELWFDGVHPQKQGAILFTEWLAEELAKKLTGILTGVQVTGRCR